MGTRSIWYLIDLAQCKLVKSFEGDLSSAPPESAVREAQQYADSAGNECVFAGGKLWIQPDNKFPDVNG